MDAVDRESSSPSQPLEYAAHLRPDVRTSRLAILSFIVAMLACPCFLGAFSNWINWYVPGQFRQTSRYGFLHFWLIRGVMVVATALPVASMLRILLSKRTRTGLGIALVALAIALLWWALTYAMYWMWRGPFAS